jgi:hypothetical protein
MLSSGLSEATTMKRTTVGDEGRTLTETRFASLNARIDTLVQAVMVYPSFLFCSYPEAKLGDPGVVQTAEEH